MAGRGYSVVGEAATAVIADAQARGIDEPWTRAGFLEAIVARQSAAAQPAAAEPAVQLYDRSPVCTLALAQYLGQPLPAALAAELDRIARDQTYEREVFFVRPLGFLRPTPARRISYQESLVFERLHEQTYLRLGYQLVELAPGPVPARAETVERWLSERTRGRAPHGDRPVR